MVSLICTLPGVWATRLGMMNGTSEEGLPSDSSTRPYGSLSVKVKVLASTAFSSLVKDISFCPIASFGAQRLSDATQSSAVTGWPSWNKSPSRKVKV